MSDFFGLPEEDILLLIEDGKSLSAIAASVGKNRSMLIKWLNNEENRSVRARDARIVAASAWDEEAERGIDGAADQFELAKAKEMAHHLRWRASKIAPKMYGDKVQTEVTGAGGKDLVPALQPADVARELAFILAKAAAEKDKDGT